MASLLLLLPACSEVTVRTSDPLVWEGPLVALSGNDHEISGSVVMAARGPRAEVVLEVNDGPSASPLGWGVRDGTCDGEGELIAPPDAFPLIETDGSGTGFSQALIGGGFSGDEELAAAVFDNLDLAGDPLACADLVLREG